jgi:hypothetical protein
MWSIVLVSDDRNCEIKCCLCSMSIVLFMGIKNRLLMLWLVHELVACTINIVSIVNYGAIGVIYYFNGIPIL